MKTLFPPIGLLGAINLALAVLIPFLYPDELVRIVYNVNTLYLPVLLGCAALWVRRAGRSGAASFALLAVALAALRIYATHIEPRQLRVREVTVRSDKIKQPIRLLHISDIQSGGIGGYEEAVFARIRALNPDLIVHTGDLLQPVKGRRLKDEIPKLARLLATVNPPYGKFAVEGESDYRWAKARGPWGLGGLRFIHGERTVVDVGDTRLDVMGLTLAESFIERKFPRKSIDAWARRDPSEGFTLLMGHRPDFVLSLGDTPVDLCLAGHTHGGQVRLPFIGPLELCSRIPRAWGRGFREVRNTRLNVSAGIGASRSRGLPPIRFNCPPEVTLIHLLPTPPTA